MLLNWISSFFTDRNLRWHSRGMFKVWTNSKFEYSETKSRVSSTWYWQELHIILSLTIWIDPDFQNYNKSSNNNSILTVIIFVVHQFFRSHHVHKTQHICCLYFFVEVKPWYGELFGGEIKKQNMKCKISIQIKKKNLYNQLVNGKSKK